MAHRGKSERSAIHTSNARVSRIRRAFARDLWLLMLVTIVFVSGCSTATPSTTSSPAPPSEPSPSSSTAQIVASKRLDERTEDLTIESPAVGDQVNVRLLLPATYKSEKSRRWPVLYLLHGCCDTYFSWTRSTDITKLTEDSDLIVATPDGGPAGFYSDPYWTEMGNVPYRRVTEPAGTALPHQRCRRRCGGLNGANQAFADRVRKLGLNAEINLYDPGTHNWIYWQRELHRAWPLISDGLGL